MGCCLLFWWAFGEVTVRSCVSSSLQFLLLPLVSCHNLVLPTKRSMKNPHMFGSVLTAGPKPSRFFFFSFFFVILLKLYERVAVVLDAKPSSYESQHQPVATLPSSPPLCSLCDNVLCLPLVRVVRLPFLPRVNEQVCAIAVPFFVVGNARCLWRVYTWTRGHALLSSSAMICCRGYGYQ